MSDIAPHLSHQLMSSPDDLPYLAMPNPAAAIPLQPKWTTSLEVSDAPAAASSAATAAEASAAGTEPS